MTATSVKSHQNLSLTIISVFICAILIGPRYSTCELIPYSICCRYSYLILTFLTLYIVRYLYDSCDAALYFVNNKICSHRKKRFIEIFSVNFKHKFQTDKLKRCIDVNEQTNLNSF